MEHEVDLISRPEVNEVHNHLTDWAKTGLCSLFNLEKERKKRNHNNDKLTIISKKEIYIKRLEKVIATKIVPE